MVRLLTHNLLACHAKPCTDASSNFPLAFKDAQVLIRPVDDYNPAFLRAQISRLHYPALRAAAVQLGDASLPEEVPLSLLDGVEGDGDGGEAEEEFLKKLHHVLLEVCRVMSSPLFFFFGTCSR